MANGLTITSSGGSQIDTSNPQTAPGQAGGPSTSSGGVQPGTSKSILENSTGGIPLGNQSLTTVSLSPSTTTISTAAPTSNTHHASPVTIGLVIALFVIAIAAFVYTNISAKSTTEY